METSQRHYLKLLSEKYPTTQAAIQEIIYFSAILKLPKGTEYFVSDLHGEHTALLNLMKSASGTIRDKIRSTFDGRMDEIRQNQLANLVYYPEEVLNAVEMFHDSLRDWKKEQIDHLVELNRVIACKYTRIRVRRCLPEEYASAIDELLHADYSDPDKDAYYQSLVEMILDTGAADEYIIALCHLTQELSIAKLHIIGDIFDRGPRADVILNELMKFHDVDVEWGNHDISWMGAACGNQALVANAVRIALGYNNFDVLEDGYGINLRSLSLFAADVYRDDPCSCFKIHKLDENQFDIVDSALTVRMLKAITVIQLKLEGQLLKRHPEYRMDDRRLLELVDWDKMTICLHGKEFALADQNFPTIDPKNPLELTAGEKRLMTALTASFAHSEPLHRHVRYLYTVGSMYRCVNKNLMYHGCIPMNEDGSFSDVMIDGAPYHGKTLLDVIQTKVENAYFLPEEDAEKQNNTDFMWYLWCGKNSPVFGKSKMATFEGYFIKDPAEKVEVYNPYYRLSEQEEVCRRILEEFGVDAEKGHIINGHVPVKLKQGESPVKGGGKLFVIDGGISKAYQTKTGIAGYTLIYNSHHLALAEHKSYFDEAQGASPIEPSVHIVEQMEKRVLVEDTDDGAELRSKLEDLRQLVQAYRAGWLKERA